LKEQLDKTKAQLEKEAQETQEKRIKVRESLEGNLENLGFVAVVSKFNIK